MRNPAATQTKKVLAMVRVALSPRTFENAQEPAGQVMPGLSSKDPGALGEVEQVDQTMEC